jgi:divalent metal cation (Fe/Co/Zn/Cd) transporter
MGQSRLDDAEGVVGVVGVIAVLGAGAGLGILDPIAALAIAGVAANEGLELWRGEHCAC